jgi:alkaline phosphatase D
VAELRAEDGPASPVVASEFCSTSISSPNGLAHETIDAMRREHPHFLHADGRQRGSMRFTLDDRRLEASLMSVDDVANADSAVRVAARFAVEAGRPRVHAL